MRKPDTTKSTLTVLYATTKQTQLNLSKHAGTSGSSQLIAKPFLIDVYIRCPPFFWCTYIPARAFAQR